MADNPNQPRKYDAVIGDQAPSGSAILGGMEGVNTELQSNVESRAESY